jgi:peptidoglycan/xylan/chitin deacetylase (PgdA/CDA1 family)
MKRILRLIISMIVWLIDGLARLAGAAQGPFLVVLCYHGIPDSHRRQFARQMDLLTQIADPVFPFAGSIPQRKKYGVAVTFDDGLESTARNALPELELRRIPSVLFVPAGVLGERCLWITVGVTPRDRDQLEHDRVMTEDQLRALAKPLVRFGSHGMSHTNLLDLVDASAEEELEESKKILERITGTEIDMFSAPNGGVNQSILETAKRLGYTRIFSITPDRSRIPNTAFVYGRTTVEPTDWPLEFILKACGAYRWMSTLSNVRKQFSRIREQIRLRMQTPAQQFGNESL